MTETVAQSTDPAGAPPPRRGLPEIPGPVETALRVWRVLRRMSTALILLFALAAASVLATVVPQAPVTALSAAQWRSGEAGPGAGVARVLDALGMFDVFGSWWFAGLLVLLFTSLTGCLLPRYRAFARVARRPPPVGRNFDRLTHAVTMATPLPHDEILTAATGQLRRRRFRRRVVDAPGGGVQLAAEKGHWREGGSLVFHTAFYVLLAGAVIGKVFGFTGQISLPEGGSFADTRIAYDAAEPGREFGLDDHRGFVVTLDDFDVSYFDDFTPREFVSEVTVRDGGEVVRTGNIRVNHPLRHDGMVLYQTAFGMAPRIIVRAGDRVLVDDRVLLAPNASQNVWTGTAKVKFDDPDQQIALDLALAPDAQMRDGQPTIGPDPRPRNPVLVGNVYFGALGLQRPVPADEFERGGGSVDTAMLRPGDTAELVRGNLTVEFVDLGYWSGLQVSHAPGRLLLLLGGGLILVGLLPSLYSYRRRVWVEILPEGAGSRVTVAGVALQRKTAFSDEFDSIVAALRRTITSA